MKRERPQRSTIRAKTVIEQSSPNSEKSPRKSGEVMKRSSQRSIWVIEKALASGETD